MSLLLVAACNTAAPQLEEFASEAGNFTIQTPIALTENRQSVETAVGPIEIHTFTAEDRNAAYVVAYSDYPAEMVAQTDPDTLLSGSRDGAVQNVGGTLISEDTIDLNGNPGLALVIDAQTETGEEATVNAHLYLFENRLYQVLVVVPKDEADKVDVEGFLGSFQVQ
ncbi:MAG: hypothetical protein HC812_04440 [Leptolyngbya sp. RL_3_1]|nr:hypothetical protein [Leptolyngbya sp. RL_3_1]